MTNKIYQTIIIGSGPAGLTAAIYASRGKLDTLVIGGVQFGGQLMLTTDVEDFPGFPEPINGPELMMRMRSQAERLGAEVINENVTEVELSNRPFKVTAAGADYFGQTLIIATGANAKWLGLESEQRLIGKGVSSCAVCDGPFFKGQKITVVGGGDSAMREALFLSKFGSEIYIIHRRSKFRAFPALVDRVLRTPNIKIIWDSVVEEVLGGNKVEAVKIKNLKNEKISELSAGALFVAIGHKPNTDFLKGQVDLDKAGYVKIIQKQKDHNFSSETSVSGVFAAGDVHDWHYQQAVTAAAAGCMAAMDVEEFLEEEKAKKKVETPKFEN